MKISPSASASSGTSLIRGRQGERLHITVLPLIGHNTQKKNDSVHLEMRILSASTGAEVLENFCERVTMRPHNHKRNVWSN